MHTSRASLGLTICRKVADITSNFALPSHPRFPSTFQWKLLGLEGASLPLSPRLSLPTLEYHPGHSKIRFDILNYGDRVRPELHGRVSGETEELWDHPPLS